MVVIGIRTSRMVENVKCHKVAKLQQNAKHYDKTASVCDGTTLTNKSILLHHFFMLSQYCRCSVHDQISRHVGVCVNDGELQ